MDGGEPVTYIRFRKPPSLTLGFTSFSPFLLVVLFSLSPPFLRFVAPLLDTSTELDVADVGDGSCEWAS